MRVTRHFLFTVVLIVFCQSQLPAFGQLGFSFQIKKPEAYDDRELKSEKAQDKKFTLWRRFTQNLTTHYNFYYNANLKLNEVLERAKAGFTDDYSQLLPFYNYSLETTQADSLQLDSITFKSSTAIALHDLRNDWADNMYLLWGASYYLQKKFDSAYLMFQFINYAFAPKEKDGSYLAIGSARDGSSTYSIATKEKKGVVRKIFTEPPSRNDAFIWQIRNFLAQDKTAEAASLIVTLRNDPNLPSRLKNDLHEVQAYWFYKQNMWDSSAYHLIEALSNASNLQEKARWEYLAAQMLEMTGHYQEAEKLYGKVSSHTTDPVLDIYARLYSIRVNRDGTEKTIEKNVEDLLKMAKKDKYEEYQDIIYYMAAQMQLQGNNVDEAIKLLQKSTSFASNNAAQRNRTFLQLAELAFSKQKYRMASDFYDSLRLDDPTLKNVEDIRARKTTLNELARSYEIVYRQDSLQRIAAMPEEQRNEFVKKLARDLRKSQGLKDEPTLSAGPVLQAGGPLFPTNQPKGEWYFYNPGLRAKGLTDFKNRWGTRPNVDNWRRAASLSGVVTNNQSPVNGVNQGVNGVSGPGGISFDDLYARLPLTPEQQLASDDSLKNALYDLGKSYIQGVEDCKEGTATYERLRSKFPGYEKMDEVLFNLYYCYNKNGETAKAEEIKREMTDKYGKSNLTVIATTGKNPKTTIAQEATRAYEKIYDLFIEGNFDQAIADKREADAKYGKSYWTPQLLYIESVYYIKQRQDSTAKTSLNNIITQFPNTPISSRAAVLLDVLSRRAQIEEELKNMVVVRMTDSTAGRTIIAPPRTLVKDTLTKVQPVVTNNPNPTGPTINKPVVDTISNRPQPVVTVGSYKHIASDPHYVVLVLNKIDPVFVNEARNAFQRYNQEAYYAQRLNSELLVLDADNKLLMMSPFKDAGEAIAYVDKTRPRTPNEILPWLKGGKYSFIIVSDANLQILKTTKDIEAYRNFLNQAVPGKFP